MNIEKSFGAVVFRNLYNNLEFLVVKSREGGHWGFPKGHIEKDESTEEAALREVFEETGLNINLLDNFNYTIEYELSNNTKKEVTFFIGFTEEDLIDIPNLEIEDFKWGSYKEIEKILTFDNSKRLLLEAKAFIENFIL